MMDTKYMLETARTAAYASGKIQMERLHNTHNVSFKGEINIVTEVDILCEKTIIRILKSSFPDYDILAEESGTENKTSPYRWIIDPLDGTTNYAHGFPFFCTSIALEYNKEVVLGIAYDPVREEIFHAVRGEGAFLNDKPIRVSTEPDLDKAFLATGFSYDLRESSEYSINLFKIFLVSSQAVRRAGSAVLDLCYAACGRFDGFWEAKLSPWDVAAGVLIVRESGGMATDFKGSAHDTYTPELIATNGRIHNAMLDIIKSA